MTETHHSSPDSERRKLLAAGLGTLGAASGLSALGAPQLAFAQAAGVRGGQLLIGAPSRPRHFNLS